MVGAVSQKPAMTGYMLSPAGAREFAIGYDLLRHDDINDLAGLTGALTAGEDIAR